MRTLEESQFLWRMMLEHLENVKVFVNFWDKFQKTSVCNSGLEIMEKLLGHGSTGPIIN